MNLSLDNPYGNVTIPRAKLRDSSTIIINPMALESPYNGKSAHNPYGNFKPQGEGTPSGVPVYGEMRDGNQHPPPYDGQGTYTVKEDDEQVGRCNACCCGCRRKK